MGSIMGGLLQAMVLLFLAPILIVFGFSFGVLLVGASPFLLVVWLIIHLLKNKGQIKIGKLRMPDFGAYFAARKKRKPVTIRWRGKDVPLAVFIIMVIFSILVIPILLYCLFFVFPTVIIIIIIGILIGRGCRRKQ